MTRAELQDLVRQLKVRDPRNQEILADVVHYRE
jgi:hypothetical protein